MTEHQSVADEGTSTGDNNVEPPVGQRKSRSSRAIYAAIVGAGVVIIATITFFGLQGRAQTLTVHFGLLDLDGSSSCAGGTGGYSDVGPGMDVVVRNNDGRVIATGALAGGGEDLNGSGCVWTAVLDDVPAGEKYYAVSVGRRGEQVYSAEDLEKQDWTLELSLGGS